MKNVCLLLLFLNVNLFANWLLFDSPNCPHCENVVKQLRALTTNTVLIYDLGEPTNYKKFLVEAEKRGETNAWPGKLPVLMTEREIIRGEENVLSFLTGKKYSSKSSNEISIKLKMFVIGLIDGINPCAFALMIFVCAALRLAGRKNKALFLGATVFVLAVAGSYLALGWGLMQGLRVVMSSSVVRLIVYFIFGILTLAAALFSFFSIFRSGQIAGVPEKWRRNLQRGIRKNIRFGVGLFVIGIAGVVAAGVESVCTGQVYLPALLMLERQSGSALSAFLSLLLYNFGFIIPLIFVAVAAVFGFKAADLERWGIAQKKWANGILFFLFLFFAFLLFNWSAKEYKKIKTDGANAIERSVKENAIVSLSKSNAMNFVKNKIGLSNGAAKLCKTNDGDLFWRFDDYGISVDFWKPRFFTENIEGEIAKPENIFAKNVPLKFQNICDEILLPEYDEYVGALAWFILYHQKTGDKDFQKIPSENLYELINKSCAGCGEETGFRLTTGRYGIEVAQSTFFVDCKRHFLLIAAITWKKSDCAHAAVLLEKRANGKWLMVRFLENRKPVFVIEKPAKNARVYHTISTDSIGKTR